MASLPFIDLKAQYQRLKPRIDQAIHDVLDHGQYIMGPEVQRLEAELAAYTGARHALTCASGTDALLIPLLAYGIGPGDAVFVPAFTYTATAEVILLAGASPVYAEVDPATFNIDLADLERRIAAVRAGGRLKPAAILAVDLFGLPADMDGLRAIAAREGLRLIEDAAQSFGASIAGRKVGSLAPVTATSFFPAKPLGCYGDGGAIFTDDDDLAAAMRSIRVHGTGTHKYEVVRVGLNGRLDTMQAAILSVKLSVFDEELAARERISRIYDAGLADLVTVPGRPAAMTSAWAQYTVRVAGREELMGRLKSAGIPTMVYYPTPMHLQAPYRPYGGGEGSLPVSEALCGEVMSLPMHPYLTDVDARRIVDEVRSALIARAA
ncbi:MAG: DegT/DnrJ/EryC1/StrS family aminotransferase [Hyphomicrobiaceae bacterium]